MNTNTQILANPDYGIGIFHRRVRLVKQGGMVYGELEDCFHGFRMRLEHDEGRVVAVAADTLRAPVSICDEAKRPLQALVGCSLTATLGEFARLLPPNTNCTHLFDLAWWSIAHAKRSEIERDYHMMISDEGDMPSECSVWRNGKLVHCWHAAQATVVNPQDLAGKPMLQGFSPWARSYFKEEDLEAAVMLQRSYLVAQGRRLNLSAFAGESAALAFPSHRGICYSYSDGPSERGTVRDSQRDFTHSQELLLQFI